MHIACGHLILLEWKSFILNKAFGILCGSFLLENQCHLSLENFIFVPFDMLFHFPDGSLEPSCSQTFYPSFPTVNSGGEGGGKSLHSCFLPQITFLSSVNDKILFSTMWLLGFLNSLMQRGFIGGTFIWP